MMDMDAVLDEALDALDDDDECFACNNAEQNVPPIQIPSTCGDATPTPTTYYNNDNTAASSLSSPPPPSSILNTSPEPPSPTDAFQRMLRDFIESDDACDDTNRDDNGTQRQKNTNNVDDEEEERLGKFMQQVQSQLEETKSKTKQSSSNNVNNDRAPSTSTRRQLRSKQDDHHQVHETIAAILGEMAKATLHQEPQVPMASSSSSPSDTPAPTTDEQKLLHDLFQSLAKGQLPEGILHDDDDDNNDHDDNPPNDFNPDAFMDGMMEQLLSKELMYEPMKQVTEKFPSWLETHREELSVSEWKQRNQQYQCFQELVKEYESMEGDDDDDDKKTNTGRLLELMQQVQEYGQPPKEIVNEIAPGLELDEEGLPKIDGMPFGTGGADGECRVM